MKTTNKIALLAISMALCSMASATSVSWISGQTGPSDWSISPTNPGSFQTIQFSGPTGVFGNSCAARASLGGTPMISVNNSTKVVELWFQGPAPTQCILIWQPVCGLEGNFGPLAPGNWVFKCTVPAIAFQIPFTVGGTATPTTLYVDKDAPGPIHNGTSWTWAYTRLQDALAAAGSGTVILVAEGVYKPDQGGSVTLGDRNASFALKDGVSLFGGYAGVGHTNPNARDLATYSTVLSGDLNGDDLWSILNRDDNSYHVVKAEGPLSAELDGFVITGAQADGSAPDNTGAGVSIDGSDVNLIYCTVTGNRAGFGGGLACNAGTLALYNCLITGNSAYIYGGGLYNYEGNVSLTNCLITGNSAYLAETSGGSAIHNLGGNLTVRDCTVANNQAPNGMAITSFAWLFPATHSVTVTNSILYNGGTEIQSNHTETITVSESDVQGGWTGTGTGNINANPKFVSPGAWSIEGQWIDGDYHLQSTSPCVNQGSQALLPTDFVDLDGDGITAETLPVDLGGNARVQGSQVDMGAYERTGSGTPTNPAWVAVTTIDILYDVPTNNASFTNMTLTATATRSVYMNFQGKLKLEIAPASLAGGNWTAWLNPDPGTVGPGTINLTIKINGTGIDISQLTSGAANQKIAELTILAQPAS